MKVTVHDSMSEISQAGWNQLVGVDAPFQRHEFLQLAEESGCVSPDHGWTPRHLSISDRKGIRAAMPLYEKSHSWGEFVFDWAWANAYEQAGFDYYPKLVSTSPFTPASSTRLLLREKGDTEAATQLLRAAEHLAIESECSSFHLLFPSDADLPYLQASDLLLRKDCQFHWHNDNYDDFDDFLATFTSAKRKKARRDRRRVRENGIRFRHISGAHIDDETWSVVYELISRTFLRRGSMPYFNLQFFRGLAEQIPDGIFVILAEIESKPVAAAVFLQSADRLYGRYWGSDGHYDALHFETCYYQGIEYCIESGRSVFEPGTQGEHKISRGFVPTTTWSAHWLRHPEFSKAIGRYLDEEGDHVNRYIEAVDSHTPYKHRD